MTRPYTPLCLVFMALLAASAFAQTKDKRDAAYIDRARSALAEQSQAFVENQGQWAPDARFHARMGGLDLWVTNNGIVYDLNRVEHGAKRTASSRAARTGHVVRMSFVGAGSNARAVGSEKISGSYNYFSGNERVTDVARYRQSRIEEIYPGIDALLYFDQGLPRYDLLLQPGADPSTIRVHYDGADRLSLNKKGELVIGTSLGEMTQRGLFAYQEVGGRKMPVECSFRLHCNGEVGFALGAYDRSRPLVIDPIIYSSYLGGAAWDEVTGITTDIGGKIYVTGFTLSSDFPTVGGSYRTVYGGEISTTPPAGDVFIAKIDPMVTPANQLVYSTFVGGPEDDVAFDIAVDVSGNAYVTGISSSSSYPTTINVTPISNRGMFVTKLNTNGNFLVYSTFVVDDVTINEGSIAVDGTGRAVVAGSTSMSSFPASSDAFQTTGAGLNDAFVAMLNPGGTAITFATLLGGNLNDVATDVNVSSNGNTIHVAGRTSSGNFPLTTTIGYDTTHNGGVDVFVTRLDATQLNGAQLSYSTFLGGGDYDSPDGLATDNLGHIYVTGATASTNFPTRNAHQQAFGGGTGFEGDAFVTKINPFVARATQLVYSTFIGGDSTEAATDIAVNANQQAYITGWTASADFPATGNAVMGSFANDSSDIFVAKFGATGTLLYSTYLNGSGGDRANAIALSANDEINIAGVTWSTDFPVTDNVMQGTIDGTTQPDGFVLRFSILEVTSPVGGEVICAGSIRTITWTGGTSENYDVYISSNGGVTFNPIALNVVGNSLAWPIPATFPADSDYQVRVVVSGEDENDVSNANFRINTPPRITTQPLNSTQAQGGTATFTTAGNGTPTPLVRWEVDTGDGTWRVIPGATDRTLTLNDVNASQNENRYRAVYYNSCDTVESNAAVLTVASVNLTAPNGGEQICAGSTFQITWDSDENSTIFDLAFSPDGGLSWQTITTGVQGNSYNWAVPGTLVGNGFRIQVSLANGQARDASDASFTILQRARISRQPVNATGGQGGSITFTAEATGLPQPTVQWQVETGGNWSDISGANGQGLTLSNLSLTQNGTRYRVIYSNTCGSDTSLPVTLTVNTTTGVDRDESGASGLRLSVSPNPVGTSGKLDLTIPQTSRVVLTVTDLRGVVVARLIDRQMSAGQHSVAFDASTLPNGVYMLDLSAGTDRRALKITVAR